MSARTKKHTTVTITRAWLKKFKCCAAGIASIEHLLPAKISTDVEQNLDLAYEICNTPRAQGANDTLFLAIMVDDADYTSPDSDYYDTPKHDTYHNNFSADVGLTAQYLANVADALATKEGR